jgi:peptidoglycan/xylan/chitin deacetylase (PgdA/CDA1 family)
MILSYLAVFRVAPAEPVSQNSTLENFKDIGSKIASCHCVAFRLDDVQDNELTKPQIAVMNLFKEKNLSLTVGIIANNISKGERLVSSYIKERIDNNQNKNSKDEIEIANHSWNHEHFLNLNINEQSDSIKKADEKIKKIFNITPIIFIPPYNEFNNDTILAAIKNNMKYFSADTRDHAIYSARSNVTIYHLPKTAITGGCTNCRSDYKNASWFGVSHEKTMNQIDKSLSNYGYAVVLMLPDEYSIGHEEWNSQNIIDWNQIGELKLLVRKIQEEGLQIVTIGDIINRFRIYN